jgi:hypothetical protein
MRGAIKLRGGPTLYALELVGGDVWDLTFPLVDEDGDPANLAGLTAEAEIAADDQANVNFAATISGSSVRLVLTPEQTAAFDWEIAGFDLRLSNGDASVRVTPIAGTIRRVPPVTVPGP